MVKSWTMLLKPTKEIQIFENQYHHIDCAFTHNYTFKMKKGEKYDNTVINIIYTYIITQHKRISSVIVR
jgi:hypothetical protein